MRRLLPSLSFVTLFVPACAQEDAPALPAGPALVYENAFPAQAGFDRPLFVAFHATDPGHAYVVTQPGFVFAVPRDGSKSERRVFLDLSKRVFLDNWEEGLLGFAFDPRYADNGHVFVYWSEKIASRAGAMGNGKNAKSNRQSVISRFHTKVDGGVRTVDLDTELRVLEIFQPFGNHNGGTIEFGPDGMLYVGLGDGGAANDPYDNGQAKSTLLGKVLRIDVRNATAAQPYAVPPDTPFVAEAGARGEIWSYGMRNPWRITFDRATGDLWCADVGQNEIEEVDRLVKGGNYGWNAYEGKAVFVRSRGLPADAIPPVAEYTHAEGLSITGGYVYRGKAIPQLEGWFVYGDFMTMRMWACKEDRAGGKHAVVTLARAPQQVSSFAEEPDGELLFTGFEGKNGKVGRLVPATKPAK
jgi:glucose/arabinose dehydrogenase